MGQIGSAMTNPNTMAPDPSGFSGAEWGARLLGGATKGLLQGYSNMQNVNQMQRSAGGGAMAPAGYQQGPMIQPQIYDPTKRGLGTNANFYGGEAGQ